MDKADLLKQKERERYQKNRVERIAYAKAYAKANPEKVRQYYENSRRGRPQPVLAVAVAETVINELLGPPIFKYHDKPKKVNFD